MDRQAQTNRHYQDEADTDIDEDTDTNTHIDTTSAGQKQMHAGWGQLC